MFSWWSYLDERDRLLIYLHSFTPHCAAPHRTASHHRTHAQARVTKKQADALGHAYLTRVIDCCSAHLVLLVIEGLCEDKTVPILDWLQVLNLK